MSGGSVALVTGSLGLVGSAAARRFAGLGLDVVGLDSDARAGFFGAGASTAPMRAVLEAELPGYRHVALDLRDEAGVAALVAAWGERLAVVLHAAAQPSHDWAAGAPKVDFAINAGATLTLLEAVRAHAPAALFLFMSSNKVYGDAPNRLPLVARATRFALPEGHPFARHGIDESLSIDQCRHSLFGVSKAAADLMVQEYAARFGLTAQVFRAGCITGPEHRAVSDHGFLAYLCRQVVAGEPYRVIGHRGLQVRDNLHVEDLAEAFARAVAAPQSGVFNIGGGPGATVSVIEALDLAATRAGRRPVVAYDDEARYGDHMWWVSDNRRFARAYPGWTPTRDADQLIGGLVENLLR